MWGTRTIRQVPVSQLSKYEKIKSITPIAMNPACNGIYKSKYTKKQISYKEYLNLDDNQREKGKKRVSYNDYKKHQEYYQKQVKDEMITGLKCESDYEGVYIACNYTVFYKRIFINKKCWVN